MTDPRSAATPGARAAACRIVSLRPRPLARGWAYS